MRERERWYFQRKYTFITSKSFCGVEYQGVDPQNQNKCYFYWSALDKWVFSTFQNIGPHRSNKILSWLSFGISLATDWWMRSTLWWVSVEHLMIVYPNSSSSRGYNKPCPHFCTIKPGKSATAETSMWLHWNIKNLRMIHNVCCNSQIYPTISNHVKFPLVMQ